MCIGLSKTLPHIQPKPEYVAFLENANDLTDSPFRLNARFRFPLQVLVSLYVICKMFLSGFRKFQYLRNRSASCLSGMKSRRRLIDEDGGCLSLAGSQTWIRGRRTGQILKFTNNSKVRYFTFTLISVRYSLVRGSRVIITSRLRSAQDCLDGSWTPKSKYFSASWPGTIFVLSFQFHCSVNLLNPEEAMAAYMIHDT